MSATGPLAGLKVIELAHIMAGPVCGQLLADMGADVIKVEKVPGGDDTRRMVPPQIDGESAAFMILNRNKRGAAINMKSAAGKAVLLKMLGEADVVIENFRVGTMERLGLGYDSLHRTEPGLIYCQITGFGRSGPYADRAGFDLIAQGMSGLMSVTGEGPGHPPIKAGVPVGDISAGMLAAMGILAAYIHRLKTGEGQLVDTSLLEASIVNTAWVSAIFFATGISPGALGSAHPLAAPYQALPTRDGWVNVGAANQANWLRLVEVIEQPELAADPRFVDNSARMQNLPALIEILTQSFSQRDTADWLARLAGRGRAGKPGVVHRRHAQGPAGARARDGGRCRAQPPRQHQSTGLTGQVFRDADQHPARRAAARRTHARNSQRVRLSRCRDRCAGGGRGCYRRK